MPSVSFSLGRSTLVQALGSNADENVQLHFSRNSGVPNRGNRRLDCTVVVGVCEEMDADATGWGCQSSLMILLLHWRPQQENCQVI